MIRSAIELFYRCWFPQQGEWGGQSWLSLLVVGPRHVADQTVRVGDRQYLDVTTLDAAASAA